MIRRLQLFVIGGVVLVAAFSTALPFLFYLVYLAILVIGGSYILTRLGLSDLEAGYAVSQLHGQVGDQLRVTYTLRNTSRWPKFWLEVHNPSNLPGGLHGRALAVATGAKNDRIGEVRLDGAGDHVARDDAARPPVHDDEIQHLGPRKHGHAALGDFLLERLIRAQQQLLAGFGFGPNLRYLRIARNNKRISDIAFKDQVIATVTQIENIYWDLVSAYEQTRVNEQSFAFAQQTLDNAKKQLQLESVPTMEVLRAEAEVSKRDQELTVARTNLQLQETLMKNAVTKSLDDPVLEAMPVVPTDEQIQPAPIEAVKPIRDLIADAQHNRPELAESDIDLVNRQISRRASRNALLPSLSLVGFYGGTGLAGPLNPLCPDCTSNVPGDFAGALRNAFNNSSPDYYIGLNLSIPIRNRVAKADQYRSELEYRQAELRSEQLKKQVRIEVRNAQYALDQTGARVEAARKARDLAQRTFDITKKEQELGAGSSYQTLSAQRDLALAELDLVGAMTTYQKAKVELDRATGTTLEHNGILIQDAISGVASHHTP